MVLENQLQFFLTFQMQLLLLLILVVLPQKQFFVKTLQGTLVFKYILFVTLCLCTSVRWQYVDFFFKELADTGPLWGA